MTSSSAAIKSLSNELKNLKAEGMEGFTINVNEENIFLWSVGIYGPPNTLYQGGYFKALIKFPSNYPFSPPAMRFTTKFWHPNVYTDGTLCISILHPPVVDPHNKEELISERWNPTQNVRTILMSVISLLNEPNTSSPANIDASNAYKRWKEVNDSEYSVTVRRQVELSKLEAEKEGIRVPETLEEYCIKTILPQPIEEEDSDGFEIVDDDVYYEDDDEDDVCDYEEVEEEDDSGQSSN